MYFKKQLFFTCLVVNLCSYAMEQTTFQMPKKTIAVRGTDGGIIGVSEDIIAQISVLQNYFGDSQEMQTLEGEKECSFEGNVIDFIQYPLLKIFSTHEDSPESLDLNSEILKTTFGCIANKKNITRLDKKDVLGVFEVAHCLGVSENIMKKLTQHASSLISKKEFRDNNENPLYVMLRDGHYFTSIKQLFNGKRLVTAIDSAKETNVLSLQSRNIDTLDGIAEVALACPRVTRLNLSKNNLRTLNIVLLCACWPGLQIIKANKTGTSEVIWPTALSHSVSIKLNNNCLTEDAFIIPEQAVVSLKNNKAKINPDAIIKKPTIFEKHRPLLKTLVDPQVMLKTGAGFIIYTGIFAGIPLCAFKFFSSESLLPLLRNNCRDPLFLGAMFSWPLCTTALFYTQHLFPQALTHNMQYQYKPGKVIIDQNKDD